MSYCRWSSANGRCDVYVYHDIYGGWVTHVASKRRPEGAPSNGVEFLLGDDVNSVEKYKAAAAIHRKWLEENPGRAINHPEAGKSFCHSEPGLCADNLERLLSEGFLVPRFAIQALREEQKGMGRGRD